MVYYQISSLHWCDSLRDAPENLSIKKGPICIFRMILLLLSPHLPFVSEILEAPHHASAFFFGPEACVTKEPGLQQFWENKVRLVQSRLVRLADEPKESSVRRSVGGAKNTQGGWLIG